MNNPKKNRRSACTIHAFTFSRWHLAGDPQTIWNAGCNVLVEMFARVFAFLTRRFCISPREGQLTSVHLVPELSPEVS